VSEFGSAPLTKTVGITSKTSDLILGTRNGNVESDDGVSVTGEVTQGGADDQREAVGPVGADVNARSQYVDWTRGGHASDSWRAVNIYVVANT